MTLLWFCLLTASALPDRTAPPPAPPPAVRRLDEATTWSPSPHLTVHALRVPDAATFLLRLDLPAPPSDPRALAATEALVALWTAPSRALTAIAATVEVELSAAGPQLSLRAPAEHADAAIAAWADALRAPRLRPSALRDLAERRAARPDPDTAAAIAALTMERAWFHDRALPAAPHLAAPALPLSAADLLLAHQRSLHRGVITATLVSPWTPEVARRALEPLLADLGGPDQPEPLPPPRPGLIAVHLPGAPHATVWLRLPLPPTDPLSAAQLTHLLIGHPAARLPTALDEATAAPARLRSRTELREPVHALTLQLDLPTAHLARAMRTTERTLDELHAAGPNEVELAAAGRHAARAWGEALLSAERASDLLIALARRRSTLSEARARLTAPAALQAAEMRSLVEALGDPNAPRLWVVVCDRTVARDTLERVGLAPVWLDAASVLSADLPLSPPTNPAR